MLTRKDFEVIAEGIGKDYYARDKVRAEVTETVAHALRMINPRFKKTVFKAAVETFATRKLAAIMQ